MKVRAAFGQVRLQVSVISRRRVRRGVVSFSRKIFRRLKEEKASVVHPAPVSSRG